MLDIRIDIKYNNKHSVSRYIKSIEEYDKFISIVIENNTDEFQVILIYPHIDRMCGTIEQIRQVLQTVFKYQSYINPKNITELNTFKNILHDKFPWMKIMKY